AHLTHEQHVRALAVEIEPLAGLLAQHRRREGPEALAELDLQVDAPPVLFVARVGEDAARTERARSPLHAALEPADDRALRVDLARRLLDHRVASVGGVGRLAR